MTRPDVVVVDARGRRCPQPVIDLARAAASAAPGTTIELLATDPAAPHDVAAWCRMRGHRLTSVHEDSATDVLTLTVTLLPVIKDHSPGDDGDSSITA